MGYASPVHSVCTVTVRDELRLLKDAKMKCINCQLPLKPGARFCNQCGAAVPTDSQPISEPTIPPAAAPMTAVPIPPRLAPATAMPFGSIGSVEGIPQSRPGPEPVSIQVMPPQFTLAPEPSVIDGDLGQSVSQGNSISSPLPFGHITETVKPPAHAPSPPPRAMLGQKPAPVATPIASAAAPVKSGGTRVSLVVGGLLALVLASGVGYYATSQGSGVKPPTPAPVLNGQSTAPNVAPITTLDAKANATVGAQSRKEVLNQLISLSKENRWSEVNPILSVIKSFTQSNSGDRAASATTFTKAELLLNEGHFEAAIPEFEKAITADPFFAEPRFGLSIAQLRTGKFESAIASLIDALLINPENGAGWLTASEAFSELGKKEASGSSLKLAVYLSKDRGKALNYLKGASSNVKSESFKKVIKNTVNELSTIPQR